MLGERISKRPNDVHADSLRMSSATRTKEESYNFGVFSCASILFSVIQKKLFLLVHSIYVLHYTSQKRVYI